MDIYSLLKKDHRTVASLFEQLVAARSDTSREALLQQIHDELALHAKTEEATFYAALEEKVRDQPLEMLMPEAEKEHDELRALFAKIKACKVSSPKWFILVGELKHAVEHHVEEEEEHIFEEARKLLSDDEAGALAAQMAMLKKEEEPTDERIHEAPKAA